MLVAMKVVMAVIMLDSILVIDDVGMHLRDAAGG